MRIKDLDAIARARNKTEKEKKIPKFNYDDPEKIDRQMGRRDHFNGDIVGVCFDSYFDHRAGFEFDLTAAGVKLDILLFNGGWDTNWDAVWFGEVGFDDDAAGGDKVALQVK